MKKLLYVLPILAAFACAATGRESRAAINDYGSHSFISARIAQGGGKLEFVHTGRYRLLDSYIWAQKDIPEILAYDIAEFEGDRVAIVH